MTKIFEGRKERDKYDTFGEQVACILRKLSNCAELTTQHITNNVLLEVERGKYNDRLLIPSFNLILTSSLNINYNTHPITNQYPSYYTNQLPNNSAFDTSQPPSSYSFSIPYNSQPTP